GEVAGRLVRLGQVVQVRDQVGVAIGQGGPAHLQRPHVERLGQVVPAEGLVKRRQVVQADGSVHQVLADVPPRQLAQVPGRTVGASGCGSGSGSASNSWAGGSGGMTRSVRLSGTSSSDASSVAASSAGAGGGRRSARGAISSVSEAEDPSPPRSNWGVS